MMTDAARNLPIFFGHGTDDGVVRFEFGKGSYEMLQGKPFKFRDATDDDIKGLTWREYAGMDHGSSPKEIRDLEEWLLKVIPAIPEEEASSSSFFGIIQSNRSEQTLNGSIVRDQLIVARSQVVKILLHLAPLPGRRAIQFLYPAAFFGQRKIDFALCPRPRLHIPPPSRKTFTMAEKVVTYEEFAAHQQRDNLWILLHGKVYDVSKFLDEHPGGEEVIMAEAGEFLNTSPIILPAPVLDPARGRKDATESFEDVGHSDEARGMLKDLLVGTFDGGDKLKAAPIPSANADHAPKANVVSNSGPSPVAFMIPLACLGAYFAWRFYGA
ncbi:11837_t:CDS:2 [Acaulospora colombiana]|uniref:11837_t:CDS:1 n=1 Tax=Acaulospora colombiana TaxID=27376 RepID=A0ACA9LP08_9GLOM|nr:11837_t:CDS:2 [Acaulospora colombiana]